MEKCYYCGDEANFPPHKGTPHWCCESHWSRCKKNKEINSKSKKGKKAWNKSVPQSNESKFKQSKSMKLKWENEEYKNKQKNTRKSKEYLEKMNLLRTGNSNPMFGKNISENHKKKLRLNTQKLKERYPIFFSVEEVRNYKGKIQCRCKYCGSWFTPNRYQLYERIRQLENEFGNDKSFLYCCEEHKFLCPYSNRISPDTLPMYEIYRRKVITETNKSLRNNNLENIELRGIKNGYHLDHKYSIIDGFKNGILPSIIGSIENLQIIKDKVNLIKNRESWITLNELLGEK